MRVLPAKFGFRRNAGANICRAGHTRHFLEYADLNFRQLGIALLLITVVPAAYAGKPKDLAAELRPAQQALSKGDYARAFKGFSHYAKHNALAQFSLGIIYKNGWGRPADPRQACAWFERSAQHHVPAAQQFYGDCLVQGIDHAVDYAAAIDWYQKAAAGGDLIALCSAADLIIKGQGATKDVARGLQLCSQAAQANSPPAMLIMGNYYREGIVVAQDLNAARSWYQEASDYGDIEAKFHLGVMLSEGQGGEPDLNMALTLLETAASAGYAPAYLPTAILYANAQVDPKTGVLTPEHLAKIYMWNSAAKARATVENQQAEISRIEALVLSVMPPTWRPDLDKKVAEHLAKYNK